MTLEELFEEKFTFHRVLNDCIDGTNLCEWCVQAREYLDSVRWKYPAKGELPTDFGWYLGTDNQNQMQLVEYSLWGTWCDWFSEEVDVIAWRELPEPAPEPKEAK